MTRTASDSLTASVRLAPRRSGRSTPFALEPVWKLPGALRRGILAVAKAALAARSAPQRAVRNEPTPATDKRPAARRVFAEKAGLHQAPGFLPRLHRMEERAGERRGVSIGFPSPRSSPHSFLAGRGWRV